MKAVLLGLLAVLFWSTVATAFKLSLNTVNPNQLVFLSVTISATILFLWVIVKGQLSGALQVLKQHWPFLLLCALVNPTLYYWVLFSAYDRLPAQVAQPINYTWAIVLAWLSVPILKQKLLKMDIIAGVVGYLGVVIIASQGGHIGEVNKVGLLLALLSTVLWASFWLINTRKKLPPVYSLLWMFALAIPMCALVNTFTGGWQFDQPDWAAIIWVGAFEMSITFVIWQMALNATTSVSRIGNLIFISPFLSLIIIQVMLGEKIYYSTIIGLLLIVAAVLAQNWAHARMIKKEL